MTEKYALESLSMGDLQYRDKIGGKGKKSLKGKNKRKKESPADQFIHGHSGGSGGFFHTFYRIFKKSFDNRLL